MFRFALQPWRIRLFAGFLGAAGALLAQEEPEETAPEAASETVATAEPSEAESGKTETDEGDDGVTPRAFPEDRYLTMWDKNPFLLETAPVIQKREDFSKDWSLAGLSADKGKYTVLIRNKQTQAYQRLKEGDDKGEFRIVSVNFHRDRNQTSVKVARGSETADLTYDESATAAPVTVNNTMAAPAGAAGAQPGQPGQQPNPNLPPGAQASLMQRGPNGQPLPNGAAGTPGLRPGMPGYVPPGRAGSNPGAARVDPATGAPLPGGVPAVNAGLNPAVNRPGAPGAIPTNPASRRRQLIPAPIQQKQ